MISLHGSDQLWREFMDTLEPGDFLDLMDRRVRLNMRHGMHFFGRAQKFAALNSITAKRVRHQLTFGRIRKSR